METCLLLSGHVDIKGGGKCRGRKYIPFLVDDSKCFFMKKCIDLQVKGVTQEKQSVATDDANTKPTHDQFHKHLPI